MPTNQHKADQTRLAGDILEGVLDPLLTLDSDFQVATANPAFYSTFDLTPEDTLGQSFYRIGDGLWDIPRLRELLQQVHDTGQTFKDYQVNHQFKTIGPRTMLLNASKILPRTEHSDELILLGMKDITSLRQAEEELHRQEQVLRMIFENAKEFAIIGMDLDGYVTTWNPGAERLLGYESSEIMGQDSRIIFTPEDREKGEPDEELNSARERGYAENERWHVRKDGSRFWGSGFVMPLYDDEGQPKGLTKIMRDMTAEHNLRKEREARARELEQRVAEATQESEQRAERLKAVTRHLHEAEQQERRRLAQVLHDDLQQILVALKMRLQIAGRESEPADMLQETQHLADQAIDTTRMLSHELSPSVLWDRGFVPALQWLGQNIERRHHLHVKVEVKAEETISSLVPAAVGEPLFQMVRELLFNVVKHAEASEARVLVEPIGEDGVRLTVEDDGVGCDPKLMAGDDGGGHGLGLRGIRERLVIWQGEMLSEPRPEQGCRVVLEIPHLPVS